MLLVRSNPDDLGGAVPSHVPFREKLLAVMSAPWLQVDVLSREAGPGVKGPPTRDVLQGCRQAAGYDILVYLGHGDLVQTREDVPLVGVLQLEDADGTIHDVFPVQQLSLLLNYHSIPVALLVGCLTAADVPPAVSERLAAPAEGIFPVTIDGLKSQPPRAVCPGNNAVILVKP